MRRVGAGLVVGLLLAGCGADTSGLVTRERFVERLDGACAEAGASAPAPPEAGSPESVEYLNVGRYELFARVLADSNRRGLSSELNTQLETLDAAIETITRLGPKLVDVVTEGVDTDRYAKLNGEATTAGVDAQQIMDRLGFRICKVAQP